MSAQAEKRSSSWGGGPVETDPTRPTSLHDWVRRTVERGASDLLLVAGAPATVYRAGEWSPLNEAPLTADDVAQCIRPALTSDQIERLERMRDLDLGLTIRFDGAPIAGTPVCRPGLEGSPKPTSVRCRVNVHYQRDSLAVAVRVIPFATPRFADLGLPERVLRFADFPDGLVLVTGGTGQGKSTTLACLIGHLNDSRRAHVITIEDPVEYVFTHGTCLIEQRQIGEDTPSFASALRHVLRQRPDVILIGEVRDLETISTALTAAETGHLVLGSLHTNSAASSIARIIDVFPAEQQPQVRTQLAASLRAICCQRLVPDLLTEALTPATEVLVPNEAVRRAIRENESHLIYGMMETGRAAGMHTFEQSLAELVRAGRVTADDALAAAPEPARLDRLLTGRAPARGIHTVGA